MNLNPREVMKNCLIVMWLSNALLAGAIGQEAGAKVEGAPAAEAGAEAAMPKDVAQILEEQLIVASGDGVQAGKLEKGMEYYLVYHSASW